MSNVGAWTTRPALLRERRALIVTLSAALVGFLFLTVVVVGHLGGTAFDHAVADWLFAATDHSAVLSATAKVLDVVGGNVVSVILVLVVTAVLLVRQHRLLAGYLLASALGGVLLSTLVKSLVDRPRPPTDGSLITEVTTSYPSGHATSSVTTFGALALICLVTLRPGVRWGAAGALGLLSLAISVSRVAVGVHWPTDVLGGWALGTSWTCAVALAVVITAQRLDAPIGEEGCER